MLKIIYRTTLLSLFLLLPTFLYSQDGGAFGSYTPYSVFGIGELHKEGTAFNKSMGGVGLATRNKRFINYLNPAAVTARDSLAFMADIGISQKNTIYRQGDIRSGNNTFNMYDFIISFPIYRSSAFMVGITPFSDLGYNFTSKVTDPGIIGNTGNVTNNAYGEGSVYQLFAGGGVTFWKRLSVGAELIYYFGTLDKVYNLSFSDASYISVNSGNNLLVRGTTGKFGLQYEQKFGNDMSAIFGATYRLSTRMKGRTTRYENGVIESSTDTIRYTSADNSAVRFADELGFGVSFKKGDKWSAELNYMRSGWNRSGMDTAEGFAVNSDMKFSTTATNAVRAGFEIVPNRNDVRYYRRTIAYRAGAYFDQSYYKLDGNLVNSYGVTFGVTLPVFKWYNGITIGVDLGQKGSLKHNMVRERYAMFVIGFNIYDRWFNRPKYE